MDLGTIEKVDLSSLSYTRPIEATSGHTVGCGLRMEDKADVVEWNLWKMRNEAILLTLAMMHFI